MKNEVRPMTMTALLHCMARMASCSGRAMFVEKIIVCIRTKKYIKSAARRDTARGEKSWLTRQKSKEQDFISRN